jgi:hypothetical protein
MASLLLAQHVSYEASVSLGMVGRQNRAWGLTGMRGRDLQVLLDRRAAV